ncbi:MAG: hypothetical protein ACI4C1_07675 [Lachnospiraceae bacterium]
MDVKDTLDDETDAAMKVDTEQPTEIIEVDLSQRQNTGSVLGIQDSIREYLGVDWKEAYCMLCYAYQDNQQSKIVFLRNKSIDPLCIVGELLESSYVYRFYSYYSGYLYELGVIAANDIYWNPAEYSLILYDEEMWTKWQYDDFNLIYYGEISGLEDGYQPLEMMEVHNYRNTDLTSDTIENYVRQ